MKLKNILLAVIAAGTAIMGCNPDNLEDEFSASVNGDITLEKEGGSYEFTVRSTFDWVIRGVEEAADWLDVTVDGESLTSNKATIKAQEKERFIEVSALANDGNDREVTLTLFAGVKNKIILKVKQAGAKGDGVTTCTVEEMLANPVKGQIYRLTGVISRYANVSSNGKDYVSFDLTDATGSIYVYSLSDAAKKEWRDKMENGGTVTLKGEYDYYEKNSQHEIVKAEIEEYTAPEKFDPADAIETTVKAFIEAADPVKYYKLTGLVKNYNKDKVSFDLEDETGSVLVYAVVDSCKTKYKDVITNRSTVTLRGQYTYYSAGSQHEVINAIIDDVQVAVAEKVSTSGLVVAVSKTSFLVKDSQNKLEYVYDEEIEHTVKVGDNVEVDGERDYYNDVPEIKKYTVKVNNSGNAVEQPEASELDAAAFDAYTTLFGYVKITGKLTSSTSGGKKYYNVAVDGATCKGSLIDPVEVDEAQLLKKYVDVTGYYIYQSGTTAKYQNILFTEMVLSENQPEPSDPADALVGEDEVGYEISNSEIVTAIDAAVAGGANGYTKVSFTSTSGTWTGKVNAQKNVPYIQLRAKDGACVKSPAFSTNVKRIVVRINSKTAANRKIFAIPSNTELPSGDYKASWDTAYGVTETTGNVEETKVITVNGTTKDFALVVYGGAVYIDSILVICEK